MSRKNSYSDNLSGNESAKMMSSTTAFELLIKRREAMKKSLFIVFIKTQAILLGEELSRLYIV